MKRIKLSLAGILIAGLWLASVGADAGSGKVPRIADLTLSPLLEPPSPERAGFLKGLREHGYEDGKNIIIEYRSAEGDPEALPFVAEGLGASGGRLAGAGGYPAVKG